MIINTISLAVITALALPAFAQNNNQNTHDTTKPQPKKTVETIVVWGDPSASIINISSDPKQPRQPLPASDGADYLKTIAGFSMVRKGGASADPVLRGMAGSRLAIVSDGQSLLGGCGNRMDPPTAYLSPQHFDQITVIKGPQSLRFGPANGTVLFDKNNTVTQSQMSFVGASFGRAELNLDLAKQGKTLDGRLFVTAAKSDDYRDGDGNQINSEYARWSVDSELAYKTNADTRYQLNLGVGDGEAAYADRMMDGSKFERQNIALSSEHLNVSNRILAVRSQFYHNYVDHVMDNYSLREFKPTMMMKNPAASNPDRLTQGGRIELELAPTNSIQLLAGVDGQYNRHRTRASMMQNTQAYQNKPYVEDANFGQYGMFVEATHNTSPLSKWVYGARLDNWYVQDLRTNLSGMNGQIPNPSANDSRSEQLPSAFIRFEHVASHSDWYVGLGHAARFPDYWELIGGNRKGETSATAFYSEHEQTTQFDASYRFFSDDWQITSSAYAGKINDYILLDATQNPMKQTVRNIDAEVWGAEFAAQLGVTKALSLSATLAANYGTNKTDQIALAQQAPLELRIAPHFESGNWQLGALWRLVAKQTRVSKGQGTIAGLDHSDTAGFGTLAVNALYQLDNHSQLSFGLDNLFDKTYAEHLSKAAVTIPGYPSIERINEPGRTIWLKYDYLF
jgi:iron complex outermembrane receptor protein